jgi:hypothetical protein
MATIDAPLEHEGPRQTFTFLIGSVRRKFRDFSTPRAGTAWKRVDTVACYCGGVVPATGFEPVAP